MIFFTINCHTNIKFLETIYTNKLILRCGIFQTIKKDKNPLDLKENINIRIFDDHKDNKAKKMIGEINTRIDVFDKTATRQTIVSEDTTSVVKNLWIANL